MYWYVSIYSEEFFWTQYMYPKFSPFNGYRWCPLGTLSHLGLEQLNCNFYMIQLITYFWCTILHNSSLPFIFSWFNQISSLLFVLSSIQSNIARNIKIREVFFSIECNFCMIQLITYFWCNHFHTSSLSCVLSLIQ